MVLVVLHLKPCFGKGPSVKNDGIPGSAIPATAWTNDGDDSRLDDAHVFLRQPFDRFLFARARKAHEVEHQIAADFLDNADHHPFWHLCGRVGHAFRLFGSACLSRRAWDAANELNADGDSIEVEPLASD